MGTTTIETLQVQLKADIEDLKKQMKDARKQMDGFINEAKDAQTCLNGFKTAFKGIAGAYITKELIGIGKSAIDMATDVVESESLFETSMGNMADAAREWSEELHDALGLNAYELRKNVGIMYNMTQAMGIADGTAYDLSTSMTLLAEDMASFYNMDSSEAFIKLRAGLTGETEPLKAIGILVDENTVKNYAYKNGLAAVGEELTQQQKVLGRYYAILDQTSTAQGDLARTIDSPANQLRIFKSQLEQAKIELGMGFLPVVREILPYMVAFAQKLTEIAAGLFGVQKASEGISNSFKSADYSSIDSAAKSENKLGDAIADTDKKLKKSLLGIDEINKLSAGNETLAESMGLGEDLSFDIPTLSGGLDLGSALDNEKLQDARDTIDNICEMLGNLRGALAAFVGYKTIKGFIDLKSSFNGLNGPTSKLAKGMLAAGGLAVAFDSTRSAGKELGMALNGQNTSLGTMISSLITGGAGAIVGGLAIGGPLGGLIGAMSVVIGTISGVSDTYDNLRSEFANNAFLQVEGVKLSDLADAFTETWGEAEKLGTKTAESKQVIENATQEIGDARENLQPYLEKIIETGQITEDEAAKMEGYIDAMVTNMQNIVESRAKNIFSTFNSFAKMAGDEFNAEIGKMQAKFLEFQALFGNATSEYKAKISVLLNKAQQKDENGNTIGLNESERADLQQAISDLSDLSGTVTREESSFNALVESAKKGLSIESVDDAQKILSDLSAKSSAYKKSLTDAYENAVADIDSLALQNDMLLKKGKISKSDHDNFAAQFESAKQTLEASSMLVEDKLLNGIKTVSDAVQRGALQNLSNISDELKKEYEGMNWFNQQWHGSEGFYELSGLRDVSKNTLAPIEDSIQRLLKELGIADGTWLTSAANDAINEHINTEDGRASDLYKLKSDIDDAINKALHNAGVPGFATGGFPEDGLFFANSRELVGQFTNGKTAVANNYQIVEGIKQGVIEAMQQSGDGSGNWTIQVVDTDGNIKAETIISAAERKNRRDGRTILPLGT